MDSSRLSIQSNSNLLAPFMLMLAGALAIMQFHMDEYFSIKFSVGIFILVSVYLIQCYRAQRIGILALLLWLVYALPFIHIIPYAWLEPGVASTYWGMGSNPYMMNAQIMTLTAMIGAVGGLGIAIAASVFRTKFNRDYGLAADGRTRHFRTLSFPVWLSWLIIGIGFSWFAAPPETIFVAGYLSSETAANRANFSSAWMISYVVLTFTFCDALLEKQLVRRKYKLVLAISAASFVVIFLQLMRGDRESLTFVAALVLIYFYWAAGITQKRQFSIPWVRVFLGFLAIHFISFFVGFFRHYLVGANVFQFFALVVALVASGELSLWTYLHGTWSAVLLTPLSVAGDHINSLLALKVGTDYVDLFLSIPPGFVADAIGYTRPIHSYAGPAWEMRYGIGGTHASVVPFMNFRMAGVLLVPAFWAYLSMHFERSVLQKLSVISLSLMGTLVLAAPHWLWYGEKNGFNAIVIWLILAFFYRISLGLLSEIPRYPTRNQYRFD